VRRHWLVVATGTAIMLLLAALLPRPLGDTDRPESRAIAAVRTIHTAQTLYFSQYGHYAGSLRELALWLSDDLVNGAEGGYRFTLTGTENGYTVSAIPAALHAGRRCFYSDQSMGLRFIADGNK